MDGPTAGLEAWQRRERFGLSAVPHVSLAVATVLALLVDHSSPGRVLAMLALAGATALWVTWMAFRYTRWRNRPLPGTLSYVGLLGLLTALVLVNPMFGFAIISGYLYAFLLPAAWRVPGVVATASLAAVSQIGGIGNITAESWPVWLGMLTVNALMAGAFAFFAWRGDQESLRRKAMIEQLAEANVRLERAMAENTGLQAQLLAQAREAGVHDERQRMAGEIHDTIAQGLAGVVTQLQAAKQARDDETRRLRHIDLAQRMARESLTEARRSVRALRPQALEDAALPDALAETARRWSDDHGVPAEVTTTGTVRPMHPEVEGTLLRTAQEALANVAKHAGATRVAVTLSYMGDVVTLDVRDDGTGFAPELVRPREDGGYGLTAMRRRVSRVAGTLEIESEPGLGTAIYASVPAVPTGTPA